MNFTTKRVKTQTLGEYLASLRQKSGLPLSEIAKISQVQPKYLIALEQGFLERLPPPVYVKGFLKSLAKIYGVEPQILLQQYLAEHEIAHNVKILAESKPKLPVAIPRFILNPKTLTFGAVVLLGLLSFGYLYFQVSSLNRPPKLEVFSPEKDGIMNSSLLLVLGKAEPGSSVTLNNQPIIADANGEFRENLSLAPGSNQLVIRAVNKFGRETVLTRSIIYQEKEIAGVSTSSEASLADEVREGLTLEVIIGDQAAWIYLEADGVEKYSGTMLPNSRRLIEASERIVLTTGNAGYTRVILSGEDLGILGKEGEVIRDIEFTPTP